MRARDLASELECNRPGCKCHQHKHVHCPAHDDISPSLSITERDGKVLVHCFSGCSQEKVIQALRKLGLWDDDHRDSGLRSADLALAKGIPVLALKGWQVYDEEVAPGVWRVVIPYFDEAGRQIARRYRIALTGDRFRWETGSRPSLYGLWRLRPDDDVLLVEGETDCWAASAMGITALGIPGKSTWKDEWTAALGKRRVALWVEPGAEDLAKAVSLSMPRVRLIRAPEIAKDVCELHQKLGRDAAKDWLLNAWDEAGVGAAEFATLDSSFAKRQFEAMKAGLVITLCEGCRAPVIRWADGIVQDWPARKHHQCKAVPV